MPFRQVGVLSIFLALLTQPLSADSQKDLKAKVRLICDEKVSLIERSINFDVKKLVTFKGDSKSSSVLGSLATLQIANMHMNCNLRVAELITSEQFLATQTQILQYGLDQQIVAQLVEAQKGTSKESVASSSGTASAQAPRSQGEPVTTGNVAEQDTGIKSQKSGMGTSAHKSEKGKNTFTPKPADLDFNKIAKELGIELKQKVGVVESGNEDVVDSGIRRLIRNYSPIAISN